MTDYTLTEDTNPNREDIYVLTRGLIENAKKKSPHTTPTQGFAFFVRDKNNKVVAGVNGYTFYGCSYVDQLWVDESLRGKGYGTELMLRAEKLGKERGCVFAAVNTMDWEGLDFYKKLGYEVEFERHGFLKDSVFYFLRKKI